MTHQFQKPLVILSDLKKSDKKYFGKKHDVILFYAKSEKYKFITQYRPYSEGTLQRGLTNYKKNINAKSYIT